jgi:hypothetical protein
MLLGMGVLGGGGQMSNGRFGSVRYAGMREQRYDGQSEKCVY